MKTITIVKLIVFFIGWLVSFQLLFVGIHLMNQPSSISFTFGLLMSIVVVGAILHFAWNIGRYISRLLGEYLESQEVNQDKKEEL